MLPQEPLFRPKGAPQLRDYQQAIVERIETAIQAGCRRPLLPAPTGSGKTVIAAHVTTNAVTANQRVLYMAHRRELVQQASRKLYDLGLDHGIIAAGFPARPDAPVQVASIGTLYRRAVRSSVMMMPEADLLVVDEAHHAPARTWTRIIKAYPNAVVLGLTATPCRADGRGLGTMFDCLIDCPSIAELIDLGYLVPTRVFAPTKPDLEGIRTVAGDFDEDELEARLDKPVLVGDIVTHWHRLADRRRTVVFAISRAHAVHLRDEFARSGVVAGYLDGNTPMQERDRLLVQLKIGTIEVLVNVGVLTEGWDQAEVQSIVLARPTKSFGLYRQIVGRGLRPAPGKDHLLVLDHAGATHMHGPVETDVIWTLSDKERAQPVSTTSAGGASRSLVTCPECSAVFWQAQSCPSCGWRRRTKPDPVEVQDGDLVLLQRDGRVQKPAYTDLDKRNFHAQLLGLQSERGYQRGWVDHTYRKKFKVWPPGEWRNDAPLPPSTEARAYARSRQIAFHRRRHKAGAS
ncbi:DEAD/DEAH box helicase [Reyranella soli]|uniref:Helicase n=1 Tax=Reyranella soli TaxID=1230389 RepID=A0A512NPR0_9HYPH|nr:DEAD/DEAH box helicase [Reyranella soli]GEP60934.1 helicase [Reyranella soli]